jgi:hypothetical protein
VARKPQMSWDEMRRESLCWWRVYENMIFFLSHCLRRCLLFLFVCCSGDILISSYFFLAGFLL